MRRRGGWAGLLAACILVAAIALVRMGGAETLATSPASPITIAALPVSKTAGKGASLPFDEYEAETAATDGVVLGPDRAFSTIAAEASGRRAVRLAGVGRYVAFTLANPANALVVRYAIPDSADGRGMDATLGVYVGGARIASLATTSRYGWFYGRNPFTNRPADGGAHHFFDEARLLFARTLPAGTTVRLEIGKEDGAPWYVIDLADFERVPAPKERPAGSLSVLDFGADATGKVASGGAFQAAIAAGRRQGKAVWIPTGEFRIEQHLEVDRVTLAGAGPWYSVLRGKGAGVYGRYPPQPSQAVTLRDFAIIGDVAERNDHAPLSGIGGSLGGGSIVSNLWLQHHKTGVWIDGPVDGLTITGLRILDNTADGLNFRRGVSHAIVENSFVRNSGDDGLAMWSPHEADHHIVYRHNTVIAPVLANGIGIYGGHDEALVDNLVADTLTQGGGIHLGNRFAATPLSGSISLDGNMLVRSGSFDPNWHTGIGALWFYAEDAPIAAQIDVSRLKIIDSSGEAIHFRGKSIADVRFDGIVVDGGRAPFLSLQSPGRASFAKVVMNGQRQAARGIASCRPDFLMRDRGEVSPMLAQAIQSCGRARPVKMDQAP